MSADDQVKWDHRYSSGEYQPRSEHTKAVERAARHAGSSRALVLACGAGRNALYLASQGFEVDAVDVSPVAIGMARSEAERSELAVNWQVADLEEFEPGAGRYDLITMIRYVNRAIWPRLTPALTADGWLVTEQHFKTRHPVIGPGPEYRLDPNELLTAFPTLRVVEYIEELREAPDGRDSATALLIACKGDPGW